MATATERKPRTPMPTATADAIIAIRAAEARLAEIGRRIDAGMARLETLAAQVSDLFTRGPNWSPAPAEPTAPARPNPARPANHGTPRTGRALYAWAAENDLLRSIDEIGTGRGYPRRIVEWNAHQVAQALSDLHESEDGPDIAPDDEARPIY